MKVTQSRSILSGGLRRGKTGFQLAEAVSKAEKARQLSDSPFALAGLALIYAKTGERDRGRGILQELAELSRHRYVCGYSVDLIHAALGEKEQALDWLEKAYGERSD